MREHEHKDAHYLVLNPQGLAPTLEIDGEHLIQSPAIIEYLEERWPEPPLLPADPLARARVRALAAIAGCDIHPVNNPRILNALRTDFGANEEAVKRWCSQWVRAGFDTHEQLLQSRPDGRFCHGDTPSLADVYLVPQVYSARRFEVDLTAYPTMVAIDRACAELDGFRAAEPSMQIDAV